MQHIEYDDLGTRYTRVSERGQEGYHWLLLPGGPGMDAKYLEPLSSLLNLPGTVWLVDFPGSGSNTCETINDDNYDFWYECFRKMLTRYDRPIIIGHSFGGMFPLLFPECEAALHGLLVLGSAPSLWQEASAQMITKSSLEVDLSALGAYQQDPTPEKLHASFMACMPYYFPAKSLARGVEMLDGIAINYQAALWWLNKSVEMNFTAQWIPQQVPTLVIGGGQDHVTPFRIYEQDARFQRDNIRLLRLDNAGHLPWVDEPEVVQHAFAEFMVTSQLVSLSEA